MREESEEEGENELIINLNSEEFLGIYIYIYTQVKGLENYAEKLSGFLAQHKPYIIELLGLLLRVFNAIQKNLV